MSRLGVETSRVCMDSVLGAGRGYPPGVRDRRFRRKGEEEGLLALSRGVLLLSFKDTRAASLLGSYRGLGPLGLGGVATAGAARRLGCSRCCNSWGVRATG